MEIYVRAAFRLLLITIHWPLFVIPLYGNFSKHCCRWKILIEGNNLTSGNSSWLSVICFSNYSITKQYTTLWVFSYVELKVSFTVLDFCRQMNTLRLIIEICYKACWGIPRSGFPTFSYRLPSGNFLKVKLTATCFVQ